MKTALITGITGQDGSFLAEFLLEKGYDVHGTIRRSSVDYRERIAHLEGHPHFHLHYADLGDSMSILQVVKKVKPNEIYNLAAQSHVQVSFDSPEFTAPPRNCMARWRKCRRTRTRHSIPTARMPWPNCTATGLSRNTARHTTCSAARASCSTTRANGVERPS